MSLIQRSTAFRPSFPGCFYLLLVWSLLVALSPAAWSQTTYTGTVDFGTVNVGSVSGTQTLTFNFSSPTSLNVANAVQVLTQGTPGLDFKSAGTGSCAGSTYSTCTVDVTFSPMAPGLRQGAVVIEDTTGNPLATAYIHGVGMGPQTAWDPGVQSSVGTGTSVPQGVAVDGSGNVYIADAGPTESVYKVTPGGTQTTLATGFTAPDGLAVDGAGNLYIASTAATITKVTPSGVQSTVGGALSFPAGMATDGLGNLYVACVGTNNIVKIAPDGTQTSLGTGLNTPAGVAVDAAGNLYIADTSNGRIVKLAPDSTQTVIVGGSPLFPESVAVDSAGNIYVADAGTNKALEYSPTGVLINTLAGMLGFPVGITVDGLGNVYVAQGASVLKFDRNTPPTVGFLTSSVGVTSSDSPKAVTLEDIGNDTLSFPIPASGTNPTISSSFTLGGATTCPQLTPSSGAAATLASGASCVYSVSFTPTTTGTITGSMVVTDNSLNVANTTQTVTLNNQGTVVIIPATVTVSFVDVNYTGAPVPVTVTTNPAGLAVSITYTSLTTGITTTTDPTGPDFYNVTATITTPGYSGSGSQYLIINAPPTPTLTWATPAPITLGTPLSATQLNATANTPGTFTYSIPSGTVLAVGSYPITVNFVATDTVDFSPNASATVTLVVQGNTQTVTPISFGTLNVGLTSSAQTVTFTFLNAVTLGSTPVQVLTQGIAGLDFKNTGAGTCAAGNYAVNATCTVTVSFAPTVTGARSGSVVLLDGSGNVLGTAYIGGAGMGPQVAYDPGVQSIFAPSVATEGLAIDPAGNVYLNTGNTLIKVTPGGTQTTVATGLGSNGNTAIDGAGNIYVLDFLNSDVFEITPSGAKYQVGSGFKNPQDIAIDSVGNLYIVDVNYSQVFAANNGRVVKITPAGLQTNLYGPLVYPEGVAVDSSGNVYVSDNAGLGTGSTTPMGLVYKITQNGVISTLASGLLSPYAVAVDAAGNVFVSRAANNTSVDKITPAGVRTTFLNTAPAFPGPMRLDSGGNLYVTQAATGAQLLKIDRTTVPSFAFASTAIGSVSSDSPQAFTLENVGNATLSFPKLSTGSNASISDNFFLTHATTCPQSTAASTLASGASCVYSAEFLPSASGPLTGSLTLTDNALNVNGTTQVIALSGTGTAATITATVTLGSLNQTYTGSPLSATATTSPTGLAVSFTYNGNATPPTAAGTYPVVGTVTTSGYTGSATGSLIIAQATPVLAWATPAGISAGTALSATQLNATASVAGTFAYTPAIGTIPATGTDTLSVTFTPTDTTDYTTATTTVSLAVGQTTPVITWATPTAITYGTALSGTQLNATASVAGTFSYTPAVGAIPTAGTDTLSVTFTPTDSTDYTTATKTVPLVVNQATPTITWATPAAVSFGTTLSATQLNATASVAGTFTYSPAAGTTAGTGIDTLSVTFTPTDATDYTTATKTVSLVVNQATPTITWATPTAIPFGTTLSATQLNATASVPGTFVYTPAAGTTPAMGTDTLSVTFTPTDATDYTSATKTVSLVVAAAAPAITWATPAAITYGAALSATQLNATASVAGSLTYNPAAGTVLTAGTYTLSATFTPTDTSDYSTATKTVSLTVNPAPLSLTANNATRIFGTANPVFTGTVTGAQAGDTFTEVFATTATSLSNVGAYPIMPSVTGTNLASYIQTPTNGSLSITQAGSTTVLTVSSTSISPGQSVTLTAQVASATTGTPTGTVQFFDGTTLLNTATLSSGTATYATSTLSPGTTHAITAVYPGDINFTGSNGGAAKSITVSGSLDFSITPITLVNTVLPGVAATYSFQISPASGVYPASVSFAATGLPAGATATFSPATIPASGGPQTVTVNIQTTSATAAIRSSSPGNRFGTIALGLLLLPFAGARRLRRSARRLARIGCLLLLLVAGVALTAGLTGCGAGNGFFGEAQRTYTVTLTATSGTVQHTTTVTLNVQ